MCEAKVFELDSEKGKLEAEMENTRTEIMPFDEAFRYVEGFITNPLNVWRYEDLSVELTPIFKFLFMVPVSSWHKRLFLLEDKKKSVHPNFLIEDLTKPTKNHFLDQVVPNPAFLGEILFHLEPKRIWDK